MWRSFRWKIALLAGGLAGALLLGYGALLWRLAHRFSLDRLDREILQLGQANLVRPRGPGHYQRFANALTYLVGGDGREGFLILVRDTAGAVRYRSTPWPEDLPAGAFSPLTGPLLEDPASLSWEAVRHPRDPAAEPAGGAPRPREPLLPLRQPRFETLRLGGRTWRFGVMGNAHDTLVLGLDMESFQADLRALRRSWLWGLPVVLGLAGAGAWALAQRALRPVSVLTRAALQITARGLDQRIPGMTRDEEFNRLIEVFNGMLDRLEQSFHQALRFSADASHELKTPLARLQMELAQALQEAPPGSSQQAVYGSLLEEVHYLKAILEKLLLLSRADAGRLHLTLEPVDLSRILANVAEDGQALAPDLSMELDAPAGVRVAADPHLLEQALQNLANNAIQYNRPGGRVRFELRRAAARVEVRVTNTGAPIPPEDQPRLFQRFFRVDRARTLRTGGVGLGLSLSREIARAHGGEIDLETSAGDTTVFRMVLPLIPDAEFVTS